MTAVFDWLDSRAEERAKAGLTRRLRPRQADSDLLDLASNDYLGLARDKRISSAAAAAALRWGAGSTGSRLVTGTTDLHTQLEHELARYCGAPAALVFSSGNTNAISTVTEPGGRRQAAAECDLIRQLSIDRYQRVIGGEPIDRNCHRIGARDRPHRAPHAAGASSAPVDRHPRSGARVRITDSTFRSRDARRIGTPGR